MEERFKYTTTPVRLGERLQEELRVGSFDGHGKASNQLQKLLIAGAREQISMLAEVTEAFPEETDEPARPASGKEAATR